MDRTFRGQFSASTEYDSVTTLDRWVPGVVEELHGVADSAGVRYDELLCMQHRAECDRQCIDLWRWYSPGSTRRSPPQLLCVARENLVFQHYSPKVSSSSLRAAVTRPFVNGRHPSHSGQSQPSQLFLAHAGMIALWSQRMRIAVVRTFCLSSRAQLPLVAFALGLLFAQRAQATFEAAIHVRRTDYTSVGIFARAHS